MYKGNRVSRHPKTDTVFGCDIKKKSYKDIGDYQPEVDGYEVLSISEGTQVLYVVMHYFINVFR